MKEKCYLHMKMIKLISLKRQKGERHLPIERTFHEIYQNTYLLRFGFSNLLVLCHNR